MVVDDCGHLFSQVLLGVAIARVFCNDVATTQGCTRRDYERCDPGNVETCSVLNQTIGTSRQPRRLRMPAAGGRDTTIMPA